MKYGYITGLLATAVLGLAGCAEENAWSSQEGGKGNISLSLNTDTEISTKKPLFRSGEGETRAQGTLSDYITMPSPKDFSVKLEKADGSYSKTWNDFETFREEASTTGFKAGAYTLTAFYGKKGEQDFAKPYFEATAAISVVSEKTSEVELTAELTNSMVKVNYTDNFKNYMSDYHTRLRTDGRSEEIVFKNTETRAAFIEPKNANLTVHFTTASKGQTAQVSLGDFAPMAKTLHNVTLDVAANEYGNATLTASFDSSLTDENIEIDLSDDLFVTPAPTVTCKGFENASTVEMLEGTAGAEALTMNISAKGTIAKAELKVTEEGGNFIPAWCANADGSSNTGCTIDLCAATPQQQKQLEDAGIKAIGLYPEAKPNDMAILDLTQCGKAFNEKGTYTISLIVTDKRGKVSDAQSIVINTLPIEIEMVGTPTILFGSGKATLTMDYNGKNAATDVTFTAVNANGMHEEAPVNSCEEVKETRGFGFEKKRYIYNLNLPYTSKSSIEIKAFHHGKEVDKYAVPVIEPRYTIEAVDAFAHYAYVKITTPDNTNNPSVLAAVTSNIRLKSGGTELTITDRDASNGIVTVTGLANAGTDYTINSSCIISNPTEKWNTESKTFTTETEKQIPNWDFQTPEEALSSGTLQVGGRYTYLGVEYHHNSSFSYILPSGWTTINSKTAYSGAQNKNTWFVVPSSWLDNGRGYMRNVGYHHNGTTPPNSSSAFPITFCKNSPADSDFIHAAGELFLGSYSFNGTETRTDGISFTSRPSSIIFDYEYNGINDSDNGLVVLEILDASNNPLQYENITLSGTGSQTINLNYGKFKGNAAILRLCFKSSDNPNPPIFIPSGDALDEGKVANQDVDQNKYKAVATGSELWIDNVRLNYESAPNTSTASQSPKKVKKISKRR